MNVKKISVHAIGMSFAAVAVWLLNTYGGVAVPAEVAVAFGTIAAAVVSFFTPDSMEE